jgi:hypothetical protein
MASPFQPTTMLEVAYRVLYGKRLSKYNGAMNSGWVFDHTTVTTADGDRIDTYFVADTTRNKVVRLRGTNRMWCPTCRSAVVADDTPALHCSGSGLCGLHTVPRDQPIDLLVQRQDDGEHIEVNLRIPQD